jgi:hypothetical protein
LRQFVNRIWRRDITGLVRVQEDIREHTWIGIYKYPSIIFRRIGDDA